MAEVKASYSLWSENEMSIWHTSGASRVEHNFFPISTWAHGSARNSILPETFKDGTIGDPLTSSEDLS